MFYPPNRLRQLMNAPGGISVETALARADSALEGIRDQCLSGIDEKIEIIARLAGQDHHSRDQIYASANEIFAEAGAFGLSDLSAAAHSLCSLMISQGGLARDAVRVHVDALRALRHPEICGDAASCAAVLEGLSAVTARYSG